MSDSLPLARQPVTVVFATDDGYVPYLLVALASVLRCRVPGRPYHVAVLNKNISAFWAARIKEVVASCDEATLQFLEVSHLDEKLDAIFARRGSKGKVTKWSYATYYRLFLASLMPTCHRLVYLDVDTLVCDDLALIHDADMQGCSVAGATDVCLCEEGGFAEVRQMLSQAGLEMKRYFNAGVLVIDLDRWRATPDFEGKVADRLCSLPHLIFPDQDALNSLFLDDRVELEGRWNFLTPQMAAVDLSEKTTARRDAIVEAGDFGIIHYAGVKPWRSPETAPLAALWWACAREAGVDGDVIRHEAALVRSYLCAKREAARLPSLQMQCWLLRLKILLAPPKKKDRQRRKLERVLAKRERAQKGRQARL